MASIFETVDRTDALRAVLDYLNIQYRTDKIGWQKIECPNGAAHSGGSDRHPSCSMRLDKGIVNCHSCGFKGDWAEITHKVIGWKVDQAVTELALQEGRARESKRSDSSSYFLF